MFKNKFNESGFQSVTDKKIYTLTYYHYIENVSFLNNLLLLKKKKKMVKF